MGYLLPPPIRTPAPEFLIEPLPPPKERDEPLLNELEPLPRVYELLLKLLWRDSLERMLL